MENKDAWANGPESHGEKRMLKTTREQEVSVPVRANMSLYLIKMIRPESGNNWPIHHGA